MGRLEAYPTYKIMLDRKFIVENAAAVKQNCANRGMSCDVERLVQLEAQRRAKLLEVEELNRKANEVAKSIGKAKDDAERSAKKEEGRKLRDAKEAAQTEHDRLDAESKEIQLHIPNMTHPAAPVGGGDDANVEVRRGKTEVRKFDFPPLDHVQLGEQLDLFDFEAGARTTGHGFYFLKNDADGASEGLAIGIVTEQPLTG